MHYQTDFLYVNVNFTYCWKSQMFKKTTTEIWSEQPDLKTDLQKNSIWIIFQTTYDCALKWSCNNWISCDSRLSRLVTYDKIPIGYAHKSDFDRVSEHSLSWPQASESCRLQYTAWNFWGGTIKGTCFVFLISLLV